MLRHKRTCNIFLLINVYVYIVMMIQKLHTHTHTRAIYIAMTEIAKINRLGFLWIWNPDPHGKNYRIIRCLPQLSRGYDMFPQVSWVKRTSQVGTVEPPDGIYACFAIISGEVLPEFKAEDHGIISIIWKKSNTPHEVQHCSLESWGPGI